MSDPLVWVHPLNHKSWILFQCFFTPPTPILHTYLQKLPSQLLQMSKLLTTEYSSTSSLSMFWFWIQNITLIPPVYIQMCVSAGPLFPRPRLSSLFQIWFSFRTCNIWAFPRYVPCNFSIFTFLPYFRNKRKYSVFPSPGTYFLISLFWFQFQNSNS